MVIEIERQDNKVLHYLKSTPSVPKDFQPSGPVEIELDWKRRFDHMQQHSAQHLLSGLASKMFGWKTASWNLGEAVCYIDFEGGEPVVQDNIQALQQRANEVIRGGSAMHVRVEYMDGVDGAASPSQFGVRTVNIEGVDDHNRCCGTHVASTGHLQAVVFGAKATGPTDRRLYFWAGDRAIGRLGEALGREQQLTTMLSTGPERHAESVDRLQKERRALNGRLKRAEDELCELLVRDALASAPPEQRVFSMLRADDEPATLSKIASGFRQRLPAGSIFLLSTGGAMLISGPESVVTPALGKSVSALLQTRGGGKAGLFQGVVPPPQIKAAISQMDAVVQIIQQHDNHQKNNDNQNNPSSSSSSSSSSN